MSVEFIGMIQSQKQSEIHPASGPVVDPDYVRDFARAHETAGFDRILVPHHSTGPSATLTIAFAAAATERIHFMLAHRPGFTAPTLAARQIATLDQFSRGRLAVHFISGGSDSEQQRDGDFDHDARYARTDEYLGILRRIWTEAQPFDHDGAHYRFKQGFSEVKPFQQPHADLFRRRIGSGARSGRQARGRLRAGGESLDQARPDHARARRSREAWPPGALLRVVPPDPRRDRRRSLGARASHPRRNAPVARSGRPRRRRPAAERRRAPPARRGRTRLARRQAAGPRSRSSPAHARIRRRSSARPNRSPTRCSTTTTSASRRS